MLEQHEIHLLIVGADGMLAYDLMKHLDLLGWRYDARTKDELDVTQEDAVIEALETIRPSHLINCAAYTQVDLAETERELAFIVNAKGPELLATECATRSVKMVHISTDFVFDGKKNSPYNETDIAAPLGVYGESKLAGELAIQKCLSESLVIRTSWLYGAGGPNFVKTMIRLAEERESLSVVNDQVGSPTWTCSLAEAITSLIQVRARGLVHFSNKGVCSWFGFTQQILDFASKMDLISKVPELFPIPSSEYPMPATRPSYSVLECQRYQDVTGKSIPGWEVSLEQMLTQLCHTN